MASHLTRGAEAPSTLKVIEQETVACKRNLNRELAKVVEADVSTDESVIHDLITNIKASA